MLRRRSSWKIGDAEEEVLRKIGDAEEEVDFSFARKINDLKPIIPLSSFLASFNLLRSKTLKASPAHPSETGNKARICAPFPSQESSLRLLLWLSRQYDCEQILSPVVVCNRSVRWSYRGSRSNRRHAQHDMTAIISSTGSCQVRCVSLDVATILCIVTPHDREGPEAWPYARHERDILARENIVASARPLP
jgi:hypothetical protein